MQWIKQHKVLFLGAVVVVAICIWYGLTQNSAPPALLTTVDVAGAPVEGSADQELVSTLLTLRAVALAGTIFQDPAFKYLRDFGTTIVAEPIGRQNPFAPLTSTAPPAAAQTTTRR
jgi:hypothetical protein